MQVSLPAVEVSPSAQSVHEGIPAEGANFPTAQFTQPDPDMLDLPAGQLSQELSPQPPPDFPLGQLSQVPAPALLNLLWLQTWQADTLVAPVSVPCLPQGHCAQASAPADEYVPWEQRIQSPASSWRFAASPSSVRYCAIINRKKKQQQRKKEVEVSVCSAVGAKENSFTNARLDNLPSHFHILSKKWTRCYSCNGR